MPTTINGIGTHYYGKKNTEVNAGICPHCGKEANLVSYDTRLWFVILFIPIIPLEHKRIIDQCPKCGRHYAVPLDEYNQRVNEVVSDMQSEHEKAPDDVDSAIGYSQSLLNFRRHEEARENAKEMLAKWPDSARVQYQAGVVCDKVGEHEEAKKHYHRSFEIDSNYLPARYSMALEKMIEGELEYAYSLLDFMVRDKAERDPAILETLAEKFMEQGKHFQAIEIFRVLTREHPQIAQDRDFRKLVKKAEKQAGQGISMLPGKQIGRMKLIKYVGVPAAIVLLVLGVNHIMATSRTLHIANAYPGDIKIVFDTGEEVVFNQPGHNEIKISEGEHTATVTGGISETIDFTIGSGLGERLVDRPVYVLNPGGLGPLYVEYMVYTDDENWAGKVPEVKFYAGKRFYNLPHVFHQFEEFPEMVQVDSNKDSVIRSRIDLSYMPFPLMANIIEKESNVDTCLSYLENWALAGAHDSMAIIYDYYAAGAKNPSRIEKFSDRMRKEHPENIGWHRCYQTACQKIPKKAMNLEEEYEKLLAEDPDSSALVYLRGRLFDDLEKNMEYYSRAIELDPANHFALRARAYCLFSKGDYKGAIQDAEASLKIYPNDAYLAQMDWYSYMLLGRNDELETILKENINTESSLFSESAEELMLLYIKQGRIDDARDVIEQITEMENQVPDNEGYLTAELEQTFHYARGDFDKFIKEPLSVEQSFYGNNNDFIYAIETGNLKKASSWLKKHPNHHEGGTNEFLVALLCHKLGNEEGADKWTREGIKMLKYNYPDEKAFSGMISGELDITEKRIEEMSGSPSGRAAKLLLLARHADSKTRKMLLKEARKCNQCLRFPHHFLGSMM